MQPIATHGARDAIFIPLLQQLQTALGRPTAYQKAHALILFLNEPSLDIIMPTGRGERFGWTGERSVNRATTAIGSYI